MLLCGCLRGSRRLEERSGVERARVGGVAAVGRGGGVGRVRRTVLLGQVTSGVDYGCGHLRRDFLLWVAEERRGKKEGALSPWWGKSGEAQARDPLFIWSL